MCLYPTTDPDLHHHSTPIHAPFSATERFINRTTGIDARAGATPRQPTYLGIQSHPSGHKGPVALPALTDQPGGRNPPLLQRPQQSRRSDRGGIRPRGEIQPEKVSRRAYVFRNASNSCRKRALPHLRSAPTRVLMHRNKVHLPAGANSLSLSKGPITMRSPPDRFALRRHRRGGRRDRHNRRGE